MGTTYDGNEKEEPRQLKRVSGRESVAFDPEYHPKIAERFCRRNGIPSFKALSEALGVMPSTVSRWYYNNKQFYQACRDGWDAYISDRAEAVLAQLINGYKVVDRTIRRRSTTKFDQNGNPYPVEEEEVIEKEKHKDPDTRAVMLWLQSRMPKRWPATEQVEHTHLHEHEHNVYENLEGMTDDELREARKLVGRITGQRNTADCN